VELIEKIDFLWFVHIIIYYVTVFQQRLFLQITIGTRIKLKTYKQGLIKILRVSFYQKM